uniref:Uncharacterized protein n=1 Tax=Arundo donax TaxID=35708 RepID=A0A0A8ZL10_ARUDO
MHKPLNFSRELYGLNYWYSNLQIPQMKQLVNNSKVNAHAFHMCIFKFKDQNPEKLKP